MRYFAIAATVLALFQTTAVSAKDIDAKPIEVMILGTYHFANPGRDVVNTKVDDVTTADRQLELQALSKSLAEYKPDRILIERQVHDDSFVVENFESYMPSDLSEKRNENIQIGYRLAHRLGHEAVFGFDEQPAEGEPDYFPMSKVQSFAQKSGRMPELDGLIGRVQERATEFEKSQKCKSIPALLLLENDQKDINHLHKNLYYGMLDFGGRDNQAGAELNAYWYMRNAKMFAKIGLIAESGERIFVLVGAGHKFWLEHFLATTSGFKSVDPRPYLKNAAATVPSRASC